jgi:DNA-binding NarL/FixJ family response regulator
VTGTVLSDSPNASAKAIVVVGSPEGRAGALDALEREDFEVTVADSVERLGGRRFQREPSVIVVIGESPMAAFSRTLASARAQAPEARVVLVCESIEGWEVRSALAAGAVGVMLAAEISSVLGPCLAAVRSGQICVPQANSRVVERPVLSAREKQIIGLVVMGYMNAQIAEQLFLAESTVKSHLSSVFAKLGVRSRHEAVDLILDRERGLDLGILALGGEPLERSLSATL